MFVGVTLHAIYTYTNIYIYTYTHPPVIKHGSLKSTSYRWLSQLQTLEKSPGFPSHGLFVRRAILAPRDLVKTWSNSAQKVTAFRYIQNHYQFWGPVKPMKDPYPQYHSITYGSENPLQNKVYIKPTPVTTSTRWPYRPPNIAALPFLWLEDYFHQRISYSLRICWSTDYWWIQLTSIVYKQQYLTGMVPDISFFCS